MEGRNVRFSAACPPGIPDTVVGGHYAPAEISTKKARSTIWTHFRVNCLVRVCDTKCHYSNDRSSFFFSGFWGARGWGEKERDLRFQRYQHWPATGWALRWPHLGAYARNAFFFWRTQTVGIKGQ